MDPFKPGDIIREKYEVTRILGQGGMGTVVAAKHLGVGLPVALKFLHRSLGTSPEVIARFRQEATAGMRIKSLHVPQVHDVVFDDDLLFIVMEYLIGKDFAALLRERGPLPLVEVADFLLQACEAIAEAHSLNIIHRDLKPANLFLTEGADRLPLVKVLDFGIAKSLDPDDPSVTATSGTLGSPRYMSPEQLRAAKVVDARADVWSLGVILYELLAGAPPFTGDTFATVSAAILGGASYPKLSELRSDISVAVDELVSESLALERDERLPSIEAFAANLADFGTEKGRASLALIQRLSVSVPAPPLVPTGPTPPATGTGAETTHGPSKTDSTEPPLVPPPVPPQLAPAPPLGEPLAKPAARAPQRRTSRIAIAAAATILGTTAAWVALGGRLHPTTPTTVDPAPIAPSPSASVSAGAPDAAPPVVVSSASATPSASSPPATVASPSPATSAKPNAQGASACAHGATAACEAACAAKAPGSCFALGKALEKGIGTPKKLARAIALYTTECNAGDLLSCNQLGALYGEGMGVPRSDTEALRLYTKACEGGLAIACANVGSIHFLGSGVPKNEELGVGYFARACAAHVPIACSNLSYAYELGKGVTANPERAYQFADQACSDGALQGCMRAGLAKIGGAGVSKDVRGGLAQIDSACTRGDTNSCDKLAAIYGIGVDGDVPADSPTSEAYSAKACALGSAKSCGAKAQHAANASSGNKIGQEAGKKQIRCDDGDLAACEWVGRNLIAGTLGTPDRVKGMANLRKACAGGFAAACMEMDAGVR